MTCSNQLRLDEWADITYISFMSIVHEVITDDNGKPEAALVPWEVFVQIQHLIEDNEPLSNEEYAALGEADKDRASGNADAFISLGDLKNDLGL
jgi:hypothetical protein